MPATHALAMLLSVATAGVFVSLALTVMRRHREHGPVHLANVAFATWWFAAAAQQIVEAVRLASAALNAPLTLMVGFQFASVAAVTLGLAGLLYYLLFLFTGRSVMSWPILLAYTAYCGWLLQFLGARGPIGYDVGPWQVTLDYREALGAQETTALLLGLVGPQLVAIVALIVLATRLPRSASRTRTVVTALAMGAWFASSFAAVGGAGADVMGVVRIAVPLLVGVAVHLVYRPPAWLEARMPAELATASVGT